MKSRQRVGTSGASRVPQARRLGPTGSASKQGRMRGICHERHLIGTGAASAAPSLVIRDSKVQGFEGHSFRCAVTNTFNIVIPTRPSSRGGICFSAVISIRCDEQRVLRLRVRPPQEMGQKIRADASLRMTRILQGVDNARVKACSSIFCRSANSAHTPIACWMALAIASVCRRMAASDSASIITRASFSVPE
jgi:hypothetical protein